MPKIKLISTLIIIYSCLIVNAQENPKIKKSEFLTVPSKEAWKNVKKGNKFYKKDKEGAYRIAAGHYLTALETNDSYAPLLYKAGISELKSADYKNALRHLGDALDLSTTVANDGLYWLGITKQSLNMFAQAKSDFDDFTLNFDKKTKKKFGNSTSLHITQCDNGIRLSKLKEMAVTMPIKGNINSAMPELAPFFCNLDSSIYFASKRSEGNLSKKRGKDYDPQADIFFSKAYYGSFDEIKNAKKPLSSSKQDIPTFINLTGGKLMYCRNDKKIYFSYKKSENSHWLKAVKYMKKASSISFSSDSSMIIFTANKGKEHQGGSDIYFCKRSGKKYSKPQNLGATINTQFNETSASFGYGDTVIYYATDSHLSMGGFDIMKTSYHNGKWGNPINLGIGLNSGADDNFFSLSPGEERIGYYASKKQGGKGDYDIYKVLLLYEAQIIMPPLPYRQLSSDFIKEPILPPDDPETIKTMRLTVVKGKITDYDHTRFINAKITITDNTNNQIIQQVNSNNETGEFTVMLPSGKNYAMTVTSDGYMFHSENFNIPSTTNYQEIRKEISLLPMDPGSKVVLNNVFFDTGSSTLSSESHGELDRLAEVFKLYPALVIEVSGHTDNLGNRNYNIQLSQQRAEAVRDYLINAGVVESCVVAKGYGPDQPRDTNSTPEGRQNNRRVEAKILKN